MQTRNAVWFVWLPLSCLLLAAVTIGVTTGLYVGSGRWANDKVAYHMQGVPFISDGGRYVPERIVFGVGLTLAALTYVVIVARMFVVYRRGCFDSSIRDPGTWNIVGVSFGSLAALGMIVLANCPDTQTNTVAHTFHVAFAGVFFIAAHVHFFIYLRLLWGRGSSYCAFDAEALRHHLHHQPRTVHGRIVSPDTTERAYIVGRDVKFWVSMSVLGWITLALLSSFVLSLVDTSLIQPYVMPITEYAATFFLFVAIATFGLDLWADWIQTDTLRNRN